MKTKIQTQEQKLEKLRVIIANNNFVKKWITLR